MFEIKGEKCYKTDIWTADTEDEAINIAWTIWIEKWFPKVTATNMATGEIIFRRA